MGCFLAPGFVWIVHEHVSGTVQVLYVHGPVMYGVAQSASMQSGTALLGASGPSVDGHLPHSSCVHDVGKGIWLAKLCTCTCYGVCTEHAESWAAGSI